MSTRAVVFDLDGTLLDSLADIATSANAVLERLGLPTYSTQDYRRFIGEGVASLFRRALPASHRGEEWVERCVEGFREIYGRTWNVQTRPYDGIAELLDELTGRGVSLAILSNKPDEFTRLCAAEYFGRWPFRATVGQREGIPRKPDPAGALEIARQLELPPDAFLYVGDTATDMETARRSGMRPIGVAWGFRPVDELWSAGAAAVIERPGQLLGFLDGRDEPRRLDGRAADTPFRAI